jgi:hypothetical protein
MLYVAEVPCKGFWNNMSLNLAEIHHQLHKAALKVSSYRLPPSEALAHETHKKHTDNFLRSA